MSGRSLDPGSLRHRVQLHSRIEESDGCGGLNVSFQPAGLVWAAISPKQSLRRLEADQQTEELIHEVLIRFRDDVASGWKVEFGTRSLEVREVYDADEARRYLTCICVERGR